MYKNIMKTNSNFSFKEIKNILQQNGIHIGFEKSAYSKVKKEFEIEEHKSRKNSYNNIPLLLQQLSDKNPEMAISLQVDSQNRFYRMFIVFPFTKYNGIISQNVNITDCYSSKNKKWDGVINVWMTKSGYGFPITQAVGYIPSESSEHLSWCVQMAWRSGLKLSNTIFTDRGPHR